MFKKFGVHHFVTQNEVKANYAERAIKTIKGRIYKFFTHKQTHRYIDILQDVTGAYNNSVHRSIGMAPAKVTEKNLPHFMKPPKHSLRKKKENTNLRLGTMRGFHTPKRLSAENTINGGQGNYLKLWTDLGNKNIPPTPYMIMQVIQWREHLMKKNYRRLSLTNFIEWKKC